MTYITNDSIHNKSLQLFLESDPEKNEIKAEGTEIKKAGLLDKFWAMITFVWKGVDAFKAWNVGNIFQNVLYQMHKSPEDFIEHAERVNDLIEKIRSYPGEDRLKNDTIKSVAKMAIDEFHLVSIGRNYFGDPADSI